MKDNSTSAKWISYLNDSCYWQQILPTGIKHARPQRVSSYLDLDRPQVKTPFAHEDQLHYAVNHPYDLLEAIRKNDPTTYLNEALMLSWPIKKAIEKFTEVAKTMIKSSLRDTKFEDLFIKPTNNRSGKILDYAHYENDSFLFGVVFPMYKKDNTNAIVKMLVDAMYVTGYHLSSYETVECDKQIDRKDVILCFMQFEARYSRPTIDLSGILYHVSPSRYFKKIKERGLIPYSKSTNLHHPERVYLFNKALFPFVKDYGVVKSMQMLSTQNVDYKWVNDNTFVVYAVDAEKMMKHKLFKEGKMVFYIDPCYNGTLFGLNILEGIYTYSNIPKELLYDRVFIYSIEWNDGKAKVALPKIKSMKSIQSL